MPIQVRCPECEEAFSVPEKASGKGTRCPYCEARVRVPAKGGGGRRSGQSRKSSSQKQRPRQAAKPRDEDLTDDNFLAAMDLRGAEDQTTRVCPKCGRAMAEDAEACTRCGIDLDTGQLTAEAKRKKGLKGPDPEKYFQNLWPSAVEFLQDNMMFAVRTSVYLVVTMALALGCFWMFIYSYNPPPKVFWGFCMVVALTVGPGWIWHLAVKTIDFSLNKKKKLERVPFDFFLCAALGIKVFNWIIIFTFGLPLIGYVCIMKDVAVVGWILIGISLLFCVPMLPAVLTHMTMPVTYRGWLSPIIVPAFARTANAALMWSSQFLVGVAPLAIAFGLIFGIWGTDLNNYFSEIQFNSYVRAAVAAEDWEPPKTSEQTAPAPAPAADADVIPQERSPEEETDPQLGDPHFWFRKAEPKVINHAVLIGPSIVAAVCLILLGFSSVFTMRGLGMYAFYFNRDLDLIVQEKEVEWNPKAKKVNEDGEEIKNPLEPFFGIIGTIVFYIIANIILYFATDGEYILLPRFR